MTFSLIELCCEFIFIVSETWISGMQISPSVLPFFIPDFVLLPAKGVLKLWFAGVLWQVSFFLFST